MVVSRQCNFTFYHFSSKVIHFLEYIFFCFEFNIKWVQLPVKNATEPGAEEPTGFIEGTLEFFYKHTFGAFFCIFLLIDAAFALLNESRVIAKVVACDC